MNKTKCFIATVAAALLLPMQSWAGPVNVNKADAQAISAELKGVGLKKAQAIIEYRKHNGPFRSVSALSEVKGIGPRTIEINRANILLQSPGKSPK